jgi:2',3'-cyclic-nucleotide 2'-phosphodiesterase (5'-nucleotidase family)
VEGNAIYDSSKPRGKFTYEIAKEQHIDLISSGNHELYKADTAEGEFLHTVPDFKGSYLASNLDIYNPESGKLQPLAPRYKKFTTKKHLASSSTSPAMQIILWCKESKTP